MIIYGNNIECGDNNSSNDNHVAIVTKHCNQCNDNNDSLVIVFMSFKARYKQ